MQKLKRFLGAICFLLIAQFTFGQSTVKGFLKNKASGEPIMFASVSLEGTSFGVMTDIEGFYSISKVPAGTYRLVVSSMEFETVAEEVLLIEDRISTRNYLLESKVISLGSAEVSADRQEQQTKVNMSVETIRPADLKKIPSFGGQPDLVQALQVLPGFISTGDQGGQLYIRGGSPIQNKVLLDGMIIYNAFHSIGLFSVFDSDVIANADIYTGGFGAKFGGRISSIMDIKTRDGNKQKIQGMVGASPFGAKITLEGPLRKMNENGGGISYILSMKHSYLEQTSKVLYDYINEDGQGLPFNYTDLYGKISFGGGNGSKLSVFGFDFSDQVSYQALSDLRWNNVGAGGNFTVVPSGSAILMNGHFAASQYEIRLKEDGLEDRFSSVNGFNFGLDFKYVLGEDDVQYGLEIVGMETNFQTFNPLGVQVGQVENTTEFAGYVDYRIHRGKLILNPGMRMQYFSSLARFRPEPRIGIKYKVSERLRLKAAAGLYSQNVISSNSDRDVVNLFYGFLSGPENLQNNLITPEGEVQEVVHSLQTAQHLISGFEFDLTERLNLNVEGYFKNFTQLTNPNRNKLFADNAANADVPEVLRKDFIVETGKAYGVDVVLKYEERFTYIWLVYGYGNVDRWDGFRWYDPVFDRRHNVNLVVSQGLGREGDWEVSARWNLGSGLPFTQTQGFYQPPNVIDGIGTDYVVSNSNDLGIQYAGLNEGRLPAYHRLDMSIRREFEFENGQTLEGSAGVTNLYSRDNVFYVNRVTGERVDQLPFLPSISVDWHF
ncbi:MAG: carboxypeptidase-like regulatory domain-containing protein [Flavobacteriales bacterium]|nr:carboxypeptidase-like regulatory domain-containing protein [Flavobacteriales bacterium]